MANNAQHAPIPMVMTRPRPAAQAFVDALAPAIRARITPVYSPLIDIVDLNVPVNMNEADAAIFTSGNGVRHAPQGQGRAAFCIGQATTALARAHGWNAIFVANDVARFIPEILRISPQQRLFHLSGTHTRGQIAQELASGGLHVQRVVIYDQRLCPLSDEARRVFDREPRVIVPLFSPRTARQFAKQNLRPTSVQVIAISAAVAEPLRQLPVASATVAETPDAAAMSAALEAVLSG